MQLRCITIFLMLVLLPSCSWPTPIRSMEFRPENSSWTRKYDRKSKSPNILVANYKLLEGGTLKISVDFIDTYYVIDGYSTLLMLPFQRNKDNSKMCKEKKSGHVKISFSGVLVNTYASIKPLLHDVIFDNNSVHIIKNNGQEIFMYDTGKKIKEDGLYRLGDPETLKNRSSNSSSASSRVETPVFYYYLPQITCADYEGAKLIIDGIYYNNQKIPPLIIHMKYQDFSKVPQ